MTCRYCQNVYIATEQASGPYAFPAFVISIIAAVAGLIALGWNIFTWLQSGARVTLETSAVRSDETQWINVVVRNKGRSAVTITEILLWEQGHPKSDEGTQVLLGQDEDDDIMPYRLEPQASLPFYEEFDVSSSTYGQPRYWVSVELGNGKMIESGWIVNEY